MAQSSSARQASVNSLVFVALLFLLLDYASALSVVPSSINANKRLGAHQTLIAKSPHTYIARKSTTSALFAKAPDGQFSSSQRTQQKKLALLTTLLSKVSLQISKFRYSIHSALRAIAILSLLLCSTAPSPAHAAAKEAAVSSPSKFLLPKLSLPSVKTFAKYGTVVVGIGAASWKVVRSSKRNKDQKDNSSSKSIMESSQVGIPSSSTTGIPKAEDPLPLSDEWIQQQLKLAEEIKNKKPNIPKMSSPPSVDAPLSSEWIEQQMTNLENEKKNSPQVSSMADPAAVDVPMTRMTPPPPPL